MPLIGVRVIYAVASAFAHHSASGGSFPVRVILGTLPEFLVMVNYLTAGVVTRNLPRNRVEQRPEPAYDAAYTSVWGLLERLFFFMMAVFSVIVL